LSKGRFASAARDLLRKSHLGIGDRGLHPIHARPSARRGSRQAPRGRAFPDARKKPAIATAASSIDRLEKQENTMAQDEDGPRARYAKAEREHAEAKRALARAKLEAARAEWETVHMKTQVAMERAKRQRDC
jgi:hypothetical protein